jgi:hypothetical protein
VLSQPLWDFDLCPSATYLASEILPQRTTAELPEWGLHWILDNCKPVTVSCGDRRTFTPFWVGRRKAANLKNWDSGIMECSPISDDLINSNLQRRFDVTIAKCKSIIKPHSVTDNLRWIAISGINIIIFHAQIIACF